MRPSFCLMLALTASTLGFGQESNNNHAFYLKQVTGINAWLLVNGIPDSLLKADAIAQGAEGVVITMKLKDRFNWDRLNRKVLDNFSSSFAESLFDKTTFLLDEEPDSVRIEIDATDVLIFIKLENDKADVTIFQKMGEISDNHEIPIGQIKGFVKSHESEGASDLSSVKLKLEKKLEDYFRKYKSKFQNYGFNVITRLNKELIVEIDNVVDVVLDEGYFEHLRISFKFETAADTLRVNYTIRGKYGSGIIWSPKNADYYDMDPKYLEALNTFSLKIKNEIHQIIVAP